MQVVAVVGASADRRKFGNKAVRAFRRRGFDVVPVNPACAKANHSIDGLTTYASVLDVPRAIDLATLYVPPDVGEHVVAEIARKGIPRLWINPGAESTALLAQADALGLDTTVHCSIVAIGESPADYE